MTLVVRRLADLLVMLTAMTIIVVGGADVALAHFGGGREPSSYRGVITSVSPPMDGVTFTLTDSSDRIEVRSTSKVPVIIYGYQHKEPGNRDQYLKVSVDGVWVNTESQAGYLNKTRFGSAPPTRLANDRGEGEPNWKKISDTGMYRWHDHRIHWMFMDPPPQVADDPYTEHQIITDWKIYAKQGDAPETTVTGQLFWTPASPGPWWGGAAALAVAGAVIVLTWRRALLSVATGVLAAAAVGQAFVSPLPQDAYQGDFTFVLASAFVPPIVVVGLCALAIRAISRNADSARYLLGGAAALAALQGSSDIPTITRSQLEHSGPAWMVRGLIAIVVGLGLGLLIGMVVRSLRRPPGEDASVDIASDEEMAEIEAAAPVGVRRSSARSRVDDDRPAIVGSVAPPGASVSDGV